MASFADKIRLIVVTTFKPVSAVLGRFSEADPSHLGVCYFVTSVSKCSSVIRRCVCLKSNPVNGWIELEHVPEDTHCKLLN